MDATKLESFSVTIARQNAKSATVTLNAKLTPDAGDLATCWQELRTQLLAQAAQLLPSDFALTAEREDLNLVRSNRTIQATLPLSVLEKPKV